MTIKRYPRSDGSSTLRDMSKDELAGSIGAGKDKVPTASPDSAKSSLAMVKEDNPQMVTIIEQFEEHRQLVGIRTNQEEMPDPEPYEEVAFGLARSLPTDLDAAQFDEVHRMLTNAVSKVYPASEESEGPTDEEWAAWCAQAREKLKDPDTELSDSDRERLLAQLDAAEQGEKPNARQFAMLTKLEKRVWASHFTLYDGYKQISAWYDASPVEVKMQVEKHRQEYLEAAARGEAPEIDEQYAWGYKKNAGSAPKDPATIYGHWKAENPELYDPAAAPTKFVAFDTETTGRDPKGSNIIQVGLVQYDHDGNEVDRFVTYIRPPEREGIELTGPPDAVAVHGIKPEDVKNAPTFDEVAPKIREYFDGATVIGHNVISFDARHVGEEMSRAAGGDPAAGRNIWPKAADTLWYSQRFVKDVENHKLITMTKKFGVEDFHAHDAGDDAAATAQLFFAIRKDLLRRQKSAAKKRQKEDPWLTS